MSASRPLPFFGSYFELRRGLLPFFTRCARQSDLSTVRVLGKKMYLVHHPDLIEEILVHRVSEFPKAFQFGHLALALGRGLLTSEGDLWLHERRGVRPALLPDRIAEHIAVMQEEIDRALDALPGGTLDIHQEMRRLSLRIVCRTLLGHDPASFEDVVLEAVSEYVEGFERMLLDPLPTARILPRLVLVRSRRRLLGRMEAILEQHRRCPGQEDLVDWLLQAQAQQPNVVTDRQILDEMFTFLVAGHEPVANALGWTFHLLAEHERVRAKVVAEVESVLGDRRAEAGDLPRLQYLDRVLKESMRLYPPGWASTRTTRRAVRLGDVELPKNANLAVIAYVTQRDPRYFSRPEEFWPERWEPGRGEPRHKSAYLPYLIGPRTCVGKAFSLVESKLILTSVLQRFQLASVPGRRVEPQPSISLRPRGGVLLRLRHRQNRERTVEAPFDSVSIRE
ncbi:MAG: cytochrome P450 [Planctomycetota bacterium]